MMKLEYKKRNEKEFFSQKIEENPISILESILNNSYNSNQYVSLYNYLFQINNNDEYEEIMKSINQFIKQKVINIKSNQNSKNLREDILFFSDSIKTIENLCQKMKNLLITPKTRFNSHILSLFNKYINQKEFISLLTQSNIITFNSDFLNSIKDNKEDILTYIKIIKSTGQKEKLKEIISFFISIEEKKLDEMGNKYNILNIEESILYFNNLYEQINQSANLFKILFGEQEANQLIEQFIQKYFMNKLSTIFINEQFFDTILQEKKYIVIKKIEQFSRRKNNTIHNFFQVFFNAYYNYFIKRILKPKDNNIKEGIIYINQLYDFINQLINIFHDVFHCSKQAQYIYKETFIKMINYKQVKNFEFILAIFTSEILYSSDFDKLFQEPFEIILRNLNGKNNYINYTIKFMLKRISNFKFKINIEEKLEERLRTILETKYIIKCSRLINDLKNNINIYKLKDNITFNLFSFDILSKEEINQILIMNNQIIENPFNENINLYKSQYPKRNIYISQTLSTCEMNFLGKYVLLVNYIQACILILFNKKKSINYKELIEWLPHDSKFSTTLRAHILFLINLKILLKDNKERNDLINEDIIKVNLDFSYKNNKINCYEKANLEISKMENVSELDNSKNEIIQNNESVYKSNKHFIIDSKIMKSIKLSEDKKILENELIRKILIDDYIKDLFKNEIDVKYIKDRIFNLLNREYISEIKEKGKTYYKF